MGQFEDLLQNTIKIANENGIDETIARITSGTSHQVRFSNSMIDIVKQWEEEKLELFFVKDQRTTQIDILNPNMDLIEERIKFSVKLLGQIPKNTLYMGMEEKPKKYSSIDGLFDPRISAFTDKAPDYVNGTINSSEDAGAKKVAGVLYFGNTYTELLTSHQFSGDYKDSYYRMTVRSFMDRESSGQDLACGRDLSNVESILNKAGTTAGKLASLSVGAKQGKAGTYDVILSPTVAGNVLGQITDNANPIMIMFGMSPIADSMNKQIAPDTLSIVDNATIGEGLASRPFDIEGKPSEITPILNKGILKNLIHNTSSAKQYGCQSTANSDFMDMGLGSKTLSPAPTNMIYSPGEQSLDEIIANSIKPTIYITSNWYTRFTNYMEGSFSTIPRDGLFVIENGEISKPVRNLRLSDNLLHMLKNIVAVGKDIQQVQWWEVPTPTFIPTIKVKDCNITAATK